MPECQSLCKWESQPQIRPWVGRHACGLRLLKHSVPSLPPAQSIGSGSLEESEGGMSCQLLTQCFLPEAQESIGGSHISWPIGVLGWQCPWYNLESCNAGFKFLLVNWGYLFAQRKCTCDIGFQLRKARFSLLMLGKAWVSKVTDMAGTNVSWGKKPLWDGSLWHFDSIWWVQQAPNE